MAVSVVLIMILAIYGGVIKCENNPKGGFGMQGNSKIKYAMICGLASLSGMGFASSETVLGNNPNIMYLGRSNHELINDRVAMNWSGSTVSFNIKALKHDANIVIKLAKVTPSNSNETWFNIYVDNKLANVARTSIVQAPASAIKLDNTLTTDVDIDLSLDPTLDLSKVHNIKLVQLNESDAKQAPFFYSPFYVQSMTLNNTELVEKYSDLKKIVFYGDSITAGMQDGNNDGGASDNIGYANITISYAFQSIEQLNAQGWHFDPSFIALSGISLTPGSYWGSSTMFTYYDSSSYNTDQHNQPITSENADIIVINLGTNDTFVADKSTYQQALQKFVDKVQALNPNAKIVLDLWGFRPDYVPMYQQYWQAEENIVGQACATPQNLYFNGNTVSCFVDMRLPSDGSGSGHPTKAYAYQHAQALAAYLNNILKAEKPVDVSLKYSCPHSLHIGAYILDHNNKPYTGWGAYLGKLAVSKKALSCSATAKEGVKACIASDPSYPKLVCYDQIHDAYYQAAGYLNQSCQADQNGLTGDNCILNYAQ
ncbi:GDSL-type esterase/lipase family protein [Cysteiniphilum sp. QT6929]|uniref:SGNH/GDSL hydrolase family protein n=1 Tax=Cysteiniphilum sp. QT6929 TaxID=2975055 RepID=UPI0024B3B242|nr:GDSL-type esterase/lipase family protein [Cysteiniphilum sp. QT6929]WHN65187.1 GDSL-type esterase/lipase family protein [Cysteiniphilum sp. QT6929]